MPLTPAGHLPRIVDAQIERVLQTFGAVCVEGPKWCGKTWASLAHAASVYYVGGPARGFQNRDVGNGEVDFVAMRGQEVEYFQVSATTLDDATLARELGPFRRLGDNYPKTLLTLDDVFSTMDYSGVKKRNVIDWLLE